MRAATRAFLFATVLAAGGRASAADPAVAKIAASAAASTQTLSDAEVRTRIDSYLETIDTPIPADRWRALGPGAGAVLEEIAQDRKRLPTRRARAVSALGVVGSPRARDLMMALAQREDEAAIVRMSAVRAVAPLIEGPAMLETLRPVLERSRNSRVRATAAEVLVLHAPGLACAPVRKQLARERPALRPAFARATAGCTDNNAR